MNDHCVHILLVEDDAIDSEAILRAFRKNDIVNPVHHAKDGIEALEILRGKPGWKSLSRPFLILLDLNLPRMNGLEFLSEVRGDPHLRDCLIFVLTTSDDNRDKQAAYDLNIAGYLVKSRAGEDFVNLIQLLSCYWHYVEFPSGR